MRRVWRLLNYPCGFEQLRPSVSSILSAKISNVVTRLLAILGLLAPKPSTGKSSSPKFLKKEVSMLSSAIRHTCNFRAWERWVMYMQSAALRPIIRAQICIVCLQRRAIAYWKKVECSHLSCLINGCSFLTVRSYASLWPRQTYSRSSTLAMCSSLTRPQYMSASS